MISTPQPRACGERKPSYHYEYVMPTKLCYYFIISNFHHDEQSRRNRKCFQPCSTPIDCLQQARFLTMDRKVPIHKDTTEVSKKQNDNNADEEKLSAFGAYVRLWTYASPPDTLLRIIGCLAGLGAGTAYPLMTIVFGNLINDFDGFALGIVPGSKFRLDLNHNSLWFIYLFLGKFGISSSFPSQNNGYI
jgi:hypothetical protein